MTLRSRLWVAVVGAVAAVVVMAVAIVVTQRELLVEQIDEQLRRAIAPLADMPGVTGQNPVASPPAGPAPGTAQPGGLFSDLWLGEVTAEGELITVVEPLAGEGRPRIDAGAVDDLPAAGGTLEVDSTTGGSGYRVLVVRSRNGTPLALAAPLDDVDAAVRNLVMVMAFGVGGVMLVLGLVNWWVWRLGLQPIRDVTDTADAIARGERSRRVAPHPPGTEAGDLASAFNTMLDERQRSEDRLRQFVGDASHELRTPLTSVSGYAELHRRGGYADDAALDDAMRRIAEESERMSGIVDDLLLLARLDQGRPLERAPLDLSGLLGDVAADARVAHPGRSVEVLAPPGLSIVGDAGHVHQVVAGLVANAMVHTGGTVWLRAGAEPPDPGCATAASRVWVEVVDEGPGMSAEVAGRAFDRFYRGDTGRSRHRGGSGLGLSIAASVVAAHHGTIALRSHRTTGTVVRIELPAA